MGRAGTDRPSRRAGSDRRSQRGVKYGICAIRSDGPAGQAGPSLEMFPDLQGQRPRQQTFFVCCTRLC